MKEEGGTKVAPRSEWMNAGIPNRENRLLRHLMTVAVDISEQGNTKGNQEYSSAMFRKYMFPLLLGKRPLKSMLIRLKG